MAAGCPVMKLSQYGYKYLNWGYKYSYPNHNPSYLVALIITLVTKSHDPFSTICWSLSTRYSGPQALN